MKNILKFFLWSFLFFICLKFFHLKSEILEKIYQELIESKNLIENLQDKIFLNKDDKKIETLVKKEKEVEKQKNLLVKNDLNNQDLLISQKLEKRKNKKNLNSSKSTKNLNFHFDKSINLKDEPQLKLENFSDDFIDELEKKENEYKKEEEENKKRIQELKDKKENEEIEEKKNKRKEEHEKRKAARLAELENDEKNNLEANKLIENKYYKKTKKASSSDELEAFNYYSSDPEN